jgi:hypothetical protein
MELADWLDSLALELGFTPIRGYLSPVDGTPADSAWLLHPSQPPLAVFISEPEFAFQWLGSSTEPKAWLVAVTADAPLQAPDPRITCYGTDESARARIRRDMTELASSIHALLEPSGAGLATARRWPEGQKDTRIHYASASGHSVKASEETATAFAAWGEEEGDAPSLVPSRQVVPVSVVAGENVVFDSAMLRLVERRGNRILLSSEHRNLPYMFRVIIDPDAGASVDLWFDADKSSLAQALLFQRIQREADQGRLIFIDPSGSTVATLSRLGYS